MGPADRCKCAEESFSQNIHRLSAKILTLTCFDNQRLTTGLLQLHLKAPMILNGVCIRWRGWLDLERLDGVGCLEFDEENAMVEDAKLREQVKTHSRIFKVLTYCFILAGGVVQPSLTRVRGAVEGSISTSCRACFFPAQPIPLTPSPAVRHSP